MLLVSVAVNHVLYEVLDRVTHITVRVLHNKYCTRVTVLYIQYLLSLSWLYQLILHWLVLLILLYYSSISFSSTASE